MTVLKSPVTAPLVEGVVLAGGYSWSDAAFPSLLPRPLLPVALRPLAYYPLRWLRDGGLTRVTMCVNDSEAALRRALPREGMEEPFLVFRRDRMPRGPAGCLYDAARRSAAETFVVADATLIPTVDLGELLARHRETGAALTMVTHEVRAHGRRMASPTGLYVFDRRAVEQVSPIGFQDIKEHLIAKVYRSGQRVVTFDAGSAGPRIFDAPTYLAVNHWMIERLLAEDPSRAASPERVAPSATLIGPVLLGPHVEVQAGATIVGPTVIGGHCVVEAGALVSRSVLWSNASVGRDATVDRCLLADGARVAAHGHVVHAVRVRRPAREGAWRWGGAWRAWALTSTADAETAVS